MDEERIVNSYQKVVRGRGSIGKIPDVAGKLGITRPMIVGSASLTGMLMKKVPALLRAPVYSGYHPNPELSDAVPAAELYRKEACDGIISVGGGSAMDTAKAAEAILLAGTAEAAVNGQFREEAAGIPHLAIPATAGTGAEATQFAVAYLDHRKISLSHPYLRPDGVVLDAELLDSLPVYHKKSAALDALCQGIESYWCQQATEDSKVHAYLSILGILDNLSAYLAGEPHAAEEMMDAAYQSGKAIQITRTTAAHAMSYQLTKTFGLAHGHACMITLPVLWEMMEQREEMKAILEDLSGKMRLGNPELVPRLLRGIMYELQMDIPENVSEDTLDLLTNAVDPQRLGNHPVKMTRNDLKFVYRRAFIPLCPAERKACTDIWKYYNEG